MKYAAVVLAASTAPVLGQHVAGTTQVNDKHHIMRLNSIEGAGWIAGANAIFDGFSFDQVRSVLGTALSHIAEHMDSVRNQSVYEVMDAPTSFDSRTQWQGLIHPIRNQEQCGSCWAFSASEVLSDRVAIATGRVSPVLSVEDMVSCDTGDNGCHGGRLNQAWQYLQNTGIVTDSCFPYSAGDGEEAECVTQCVDSEDFVKTKASDVYAISSVSNMMKEISTHGPIQVGFMVYRSFMNYRSGIYSKHAWEFTPEGGHAVKIVGYGSEAGTEYWIVANSWGPYWGEDGFFRIKKGSDHCGIETMGPPYAGLPLIGAIVV